MKNAKPIYEFAGYVECVRGHLSDLVMRDRTDTTQPDEFWTVATAVLAPIEVGQGVRFTVTTRRGYFTVDRRVWTEKEIAALKVKAAAFAERFRKLMEPTQADDAVDPSISNTGKPSTRVKESSDV